MDGNGKMVSSHSIGSLDPSVNVSHRPLLHTRVGRGVKFVAERNRYQKIFCYLNVENYWKTKDI
eukprot:scaffold3666_cov160-Amphora_coffeaeformis.AAC.16